MSQFIEYFLLSPGQIAGLLGLFAVAIALKTIGAAIGGRSRLPEADLIAGWAAGVMLITAVGAASTLSFRIPSAILLVAALGCGFFLWRRKTAFGAAPALRMIALGLPAIVLVADMVPAQWDEFGHWLPTARYLVEMDTFPRVGFPETLASVPGYPEALPIVTYWVSLICGRLVENASAMFNLLLFLALGLLVARLIGAVQSDRPLTEAPAPGWIPTAIGFLFVTGLNPTFVPKVILTSYGDASTAVCVAFAAVLAWSCLGRMAADDRSGAARLAWQAGLALVPLALLKQGNVALIGAVAGAYALVALRDGAVRKTEATGNLLRMLVLPAIAMVLWRYHLIYNLPGGELEVRGAEAWNTALIPQIVAQMAEIAAKKGGYFGIMLAACVCAAIGLRRMRTAFDRFAVIVAAVFLAYNLFLLTAYVVTFGEYDALRAASYWRYNIHLGALAVVFLAFGCALLWRRHLAGRDLRRWRWVPVALALILPVALAPKIRFDQRPQKLFVRAMGEEIAAAMPDDARIALLDPVSNGYYQKVMQYAIYRRAETVVNLNVYSGKVGADELTAMLTDGDANFAWVHIPTPMLEEVLGTRLAPATSYLLARTEGGWRLLRAWPFPGYTDPALLPD